MNSLEKEARKARITERQGLPVAQYNLLTDALIKRFPSACSVADDGFNPGHVVTCCKGRKPEHRGYRWRYI